MEEILHRLEQYEFFRIIIFPETTIHEKSVDEWPFCHVLISFHSKGFPLAKTQEYARLHRPFLINDLDKQWDIMDRIKVHEILNETGIPQPRYGVLRRQLNDGETIDLIVLFFYLIDICLDGTWTTLSNVVEQDDQIEIDGQTFHKPFVEKPVSAENHDVYIYFPSSAGGGSQRLFRKVVHNQLKTKKKPKSFLFRLVVEVVCIHRRIVFERMARIFTKNSCRLMELMSKFIQSVLNTHMLKHESHRV